MIKNQFAKKIRIIFTVALLSLTSCIEDNITPPLTGDLNPVAEMLYYFESQGDFANSNLAPALIEPEEVFSNLNNYLLIDIRSESEFAMGHIENAVNVNPDSLFNFVEQKYSMNYPKIILISKNGHSSAYFACLLRLADFDNVYTLDFGMASWNEIFADDWLNQIGDYSGISNFTNNPFPKNEFTALPQIAFANPEDPLDERVKSRIRQIFAEGFKYSLNFYQALPSLNNKYPVCYGGSFLYNARKDIIFEGLGHPPNTRSYLDAQLFDFRSYRFLQTLPVSSEIFMYDYNGQHAASMTAYLRVLGYDVKMLLFGANQLFYSRMVNDPELNGFIFSSQKIRNYPYISDN